MPDRRHALIVNAVTEAIPRTWWVPLSVRLAIARRVGEVLDGEPVELRERLADALAREHRRRAREQIEASPEEHCAALAGAALPVIEGELAAKDAEIERLGAEWVAAHNRATQNRQRAEQAEAAVANLLACCDFADKQGKPELTTAYIRSRLAAHVRPAGPPAKEEP